MFLNNIVIYVFQFQIMDPPHEDPSTSAKNDSIQDIINTSSENSNNENIEKELLQNIEQINEVESIESTVTDKNDNKIADEKEPIASTDEEQTDDYSKYCTTNDKGITIYTDPSTHCQYEFDTESNKWIEAKEENKITTLNSNPYENEHYRWCPETSK